MTTALHMHVHRHAHTHTHTLKCYHTLKRKEIGLLKPRIRKALGLITNKNTHTFAHTHMPQKVRYK